MYHVMLQAAAAGRIAIVVITTNLSISSLSLG